jgi:hypothetical protein
MSIAPSPHEKNMILGNTPEMPVNPAPIIRTSSIDCHVGDGIIRLPSGIKILGACVNVKCYLGKKAVVLPLMIPVKDLSTSATTCKTSLDTIALSGNSAYIIRLGKKEQLKCIPELQGVKAGIWG